MSTVKMGGWSGQTIATVECQKSGAPEELSGIRFSFQDGEFIIVGAPYKVAIWGLDDHADKVPGIDKMEGTEWTSSEKDASRDGAGFAAVDENVYSVFGNKEQCVTAIEAMCQRAEKGIKKGGYEGYEEYGYKLSDAIMDALEAFDPAWKYAYRTAMRNLVYKVPGST